MVETLPEIVKQSGLKRYVWLYFLIVPLAASTASAVAIVIAALQGLSAHETSSRMYALVVIVGFKAIAIIGGAYLIGLIMALGSAFLISTRRERAEHELRHGRMSDPEYRAMWGRHISYQLYRSERLVQLTLVGAVFYSGLLLITGGYYYLWEDVVILWDLLDEIAKPLVEPNN